MVRDQQGVAERGRMNPKEIDEFVRSRDEAFVNFVKTGSLDKVLVHAEKYGVRLPADEQVIKAGVLKAVQECTDIPTKIKVKAARMATEMGINPFGFGK